MTSSPHVFVEEPRQKMSGHPVVTFHRGLTRRPQRFNVISMDAGDWIHEVSQLVDCLVLVPGSNEPVVCCLFIAPHSAAGYDVPLNDGYKGGAITLGDQLHKEVASSQVHGTEHPLQRDRPCAGGRSSSASPLQRQFRPRRRSILALPIEQGCWEGPMNISHAWSTTSLLHFCGRLPTAQNSTQWHCKHRLIRTNASFNCV